MIHRCGLCNRTNNEEIETEIGEFIEGLPFVPDPKNPLFDICMICYEEIREAVFEFEPTPGDKNAENAFSRSDSS